MDQHAPGGTRRTFVKFASAAIASAAVPILGANDRVNVGIVGLGGRGNDHIGFFTNLDSDCRIAAICDVNQAARERANARILKETGYSSKEYNDMREMFASKDIDAVSLPLPNHWHALATIWACQAGKDVYVEKPACHNIFEGRKMVEAARKYKRMVQVGSQSRSIPYKIRRSSSSTTARSEPCIRREASAFAAASPSATRPTSPCRPVSIGICFSGPAQYKPYSKNKFAYNWHWFWDTGNGDIGNQGVHEMDIALWGLGRGDWPKTVMSIGGKYAWKDDQETPNTLLAATTSAMPRSPSMCATCLRRPRGSWRWAALTRLRTSSSETKDSWQWTLRFPGLEERRVRPDSGADAFRRCFSP